MPAADWLPGLIGGAFSAFGQSQANRQNIRLAREARAWQADMSNTAVRRRMADLKKAGINPILAGKFDATTPGGFMSQVGNVGAAGAEGSAKGAAAAAASAQVNLTREQTKNVMMDSVLKHATAAKTRAEETKALKEAFNLDNVNRLQQLDMEIKKLQIPGLKAEADLWQYLAEADWDEIAKLMGKAGPVLAPILRVFLVRGRVRN